jgi:hypothetical protein
MRSVLGKIIPSVLLLIWVCCPLLGQNNSWATHAKNAATIPFVGCESDGQGGGASRTAAGKSIFKADA